MRGVGLLAALFPLTGCVCDLFRMVKLQFKSLAADLPCGAQPGCSVLLCGDTSDQCRGLARLVRQVLQVLSSWLQEVCVPGGEGGGDQLLSGLLALRGGGAWELAVAKELERRCLRQEDCPK